MLWCLSKNSIFSTHDVVSKIMASVGINISGHGESNDKVVQPFKRQPQSESEKLHCVGLLLEGLIIKTQKNDLYIICRGYFV